MKMDGDQHNGWRLTVPVNEIDIIGDRNYYNRQLFEIPLSCLKYFPVNRYEKITLPRKFRKEIKRNGLDLSKKYTLDGPSEYSHGSEKIVYWSINDKRNGYKP